MKVSINVDCSPEEARTFLGLPDVQPMQRAAMAQMEKKMLAEMDCMTPETIMKSWMSLAPQGSEQVQEAFAKMLRTGFGASKPKSK